MNTCDGCQHNRNGRCRAHAPTPRTDGQPADRAEWPPHDGQGCGDYSAAKPLDPAESVAPKRVKLKGA
jgi:hypothetical protein